MNSPLKEKDPAAPLTPEEKAGVYEFLLKVPVMAPLALAYIGLQGYATVVAPFAMDYHWNQAAASKEVLLGVGLAAVTSVAFAAIGNLEKADLKNIGTMAKNFGKSIVDGMNATGRALGLIDEKETPIQKAVEPPEKRRSYWASTAVDSMRLAVLGPMVASTAFAVCMAPMVPFQFSNMAIPFLATAAVSASTILAFRGLDRLAGVVNPKGDFSPLALDGSMSEAIKTAQKDDQEKLALAQTGNAKIPKAKDQGPELSLG
ncbi:hypothetical protein IFT48_01880 [Pseudomonas fluorescens]|uniref:hypothetical protein n=1 Tax=Pseudomonas TaxID=286 RepID=UPI000F02609A|nr:MULTISPECIES: hypothetical protein [Pseudomonas]MBD8088711.1 hypothetical protein [Pseudomonas fluorescens]MBD8614828.1 hypothetical protein [Pseudomonas putida]MBD8681488.1 hypothetical protein [Pseudomonas sp. CFBP 13719]